MKMKSILKLGMVLTASVFAQALHADNLKIYTTRNPQQLLKITELFQKENPGVTFTYAKGRNWDMMAEMEKEGKSGDGDIYLTKDLVYLTEATEKGLLLPSYSKEVAKNIPAFLIDSEYNWVGLALRARTMIYNPDKVKPSELSTYEDLASPTWSARMCLRTSLSSYSVGFTSSLIHHLGAAKTVEVLKGWVDNTAIDPTIGDELLLESISAGICEVGVINTHYFAQVLMKNPALKAKVFFANQKTTGTHMNGSGVAILRTSHNPDLAQKFIDFLTRTDVQTLFAAEQMEYPANPAAQTPELLKSFGTFKQDQTPWNELGKYLKQSRELFIEAEYN
jgi:iron(III) transport system substrate-binding protein